MTTARQLALGAIRPPRWAVISSCGLYRYRIGDRWGDGPHVSWGLMNPSKADANTDDPTLLKVYGFTRALGFSAFDLWNPFAFRATYPTDLARAADPVGPENDRHILESTRGAAVVIVGWGAAASVPRSFRGDRRERLQRVSALLGLLPMPIMCLGKTKDGSPAHPLMLAYKTELVTFS